MHTLYVDWCTEYIFSAHKGEYTLYMHYIYFKNSDLNTLSVYNAYRSEFIVLYM